MRRQWKRNAVVATVLLFVCAAVYLNWRYAGETALDQTAEVSAAETGGEDVKVLGEAALVGGEVVSAQEEGAAAVSGYFDAARLSRQQSRDNALSLLREAAEQEGADEAAIEEANQAIQTVAGYTMLESQIENLVVAKGYADCVASWGRTALAWWCRRRRTACRPRTWLRSRTSSSARRTIPPTRLRSWRPTEERGPRRGRGPLPPGPAPLFCPECTPAKILVVF